MSEKVREQIEEVEEPQTTEGAEKAEEEAKEEVQEAPAKGSSSRQDRIHQGFKNWNSAQKEREPIKKKEPTPKVDSQNKFFEDLSEQFVKQQAQISKFRSAITRWFACITAMQLVIINILVFIAIAMDRSVMSTLLEFLEYFIGATFIELLGGLFIIVKFVFSHEASDMLKHLTYKDPKSNK